jgi:type VI secretion system secreted protein VgrG
MKLFAGFFKHDRYNPDGTKQQPGKAGVKVVSALKDIDMVALKDAVNLLAKMNININSDKIEITASDKLELKGGTSKITLTAGGIQHSTAGSWSVKCGSHSVKGPGGGSAPVSVPGVSERESQLTECPPDEGEYIARYRLFKDDNRPYSGYRYRIEDAAGNLLKEGVTDKDGWTAYVSTAQQENLRVIKYVTRESERITDDWSSKLDSAISRAKESER